MATGSVLENDTVTAPIISSITDLDAISEDMDPDTKEVRYTTFYFFSEDDCAFWGKIAKPKRDIAIAEYQSALQHVPDEYLYPELPASLESSKHSIPLDDREDETYVKRPNLGIYDLVEDTSFLADLLLGEALTIQYVAQEPHPNIIGYKGLRVRRGRVTGILLDKYKQTLLDFRKSQSVSYDDSILHAIGSAVRYLHSIGLAHNDINPENILMNQNGSPVLIDFGSCRPDKERLQTSSTPGWNYGNSNRSDQRNDLFALGKLLIWLQDPTFE